MNSKYIVFKRGTLFVMDSTTTFVKDKRNNFRIQLLFVFYLLFRFLLSNYDSDEVYAADFFKRILFICTR